MAESNTSRASAVAADEAIEWFLRQREAGFSAADKRALAEWLLLSPLHVDEYLAISIAWSVAGSAPVPLTDRDALVAAARAEIAAGKVVPLRNSGKDDHPEITSPRLPRTRPPRTWLKRWSYAAMLIALLGAGVVGLRMSERDVTYTTAHGEERRVVLAEGSVITLNTDSSVHVALRAHQRDIDLVRGEVRFQVAKDPLRPFVVNAAGAEVRALGTVFNVRVDDRKVQVAVLEGHVAVHAMDPALRPGASAVPRKAGSADLRAGDRAVVDEGYVVMGSGQPLAAVNAWMEHKLVFRDETLEAVVEEFNRYRTHPFKLDDVALGSVRISGVFGLEDPESLLTYLKRFEAVDIRRGDDGFDHLARVAVDK